MNLNIPLNLKNVKHKSLLLPLIALGGGAAGFGLRFWLFSAKETGNLIPRHHPASWLLAILAIGVVASLYLLTRDSGPSEKYYENYPGSRLAGVGTMIAGAGLFLAILSSMIDRPDPLTMMTNFLGLPAVFSMAFTGYCRICRRRPNFLFHILVCLFLVFFQLSRYRSWIANPEMQEYLFELFAVISLMLTAYHRAAFDLNHGSRSRQLFWSLTAVFFCCLSMAGRNYRLFCGAMGLWALSGLCRIELPEETPEVPEASEAPEDSQDA